MTKIEWVQERKRYLEACQKRDEASALAIAKKAFSDSGVTEGDLAFICGVMWENREYIRFYGILAEFNRRFPDSLHPIQSFLADYYAGTGALDAATDEARYYLRKVSEVGFELAAKNPLVRAGSTNAFMLATAAYDTVGAISYSKRILELGLSLPLEHSNETRTYHLERLREYEQTLGKLGDAYLLDQKWEEFFHSGSHAPELIKLCESKNCPQLARRLDLLEGNMRFNIDPIPFEKEFLLIRFESAPKVPANPQEVVNFLR